MQFEVHLADEDQLQLNTVEATVTGDGQIDFLVEGSIAPLGSETLDALVGEDIRPVAVTFETIETTA